MTALRSPANAEKNPVTFEAPLKFDRIKAGVFFSVMALLVIAAYFLRHIWQLSSLTVRLMGIANDQEEFVEDVVPKIPAVAALYAAPGFSETARIVLAYRLKREIPFRAMTCEGEYYYLTPGTLGLFVRRIIPPQCPLLINEVCNWYACRMLLADSAAR